MNGRDPVADYLARYGDPDDPVARYLSMQDPDEEDGPGFATRALRFLGQGATTAAIAASRVNPLSHIPGPFKESQRRVEERHEQLREDPEGALENISYYTGRIAPELASSFGAGAATKALGAGRLARAAISNIPSALTFGSSKEEALVPSDNPAVRIGAEYGANLLGEGVFAAGGRALRALRGGREAVPSEAIGKSVEDLTSGLRGRTAPGAREILEEQVEKQKRALGVAAQAEINPDEYINISKFGLPPEGEDRLRGIVRQVVAEEGRVPKEVVPNEQTIKESLGLAPDDILTVKGRELNRVEMLAAKNFIKTNDLEVEQISKRLADPDLPLAEREQIVKEINDRNDLSAQLMSPLSRGWSEAGRTLQSLRIMAQNTNDPFTWYAQAARILDGKPLTDAARQEINRLLKAGDKTALIDYVSSLRQAGKGEKLATIWKAGLLTSPTTHLANFVGNTTMAFLESAKDVPGVVFDRLLGAVTGLQTKSPSVRGLAIKPITQAARTGAGRGRRFLSDTVRGGLRQSARSQYDEIPALRQIADEGLDKVDQVRRVRFNNAFWDSYTNSVFRLLGEGDAVFSQAAAVRSLEEQARLGAKKGLGTVAHLRANPTDEMVLQAIADAEYATFRDKTKLGSVVGGVKRAVGSGSEFVIPFSQTPSSIATKVAVDYSPYGGMRAVYRLAKRAMSGAGMDEGFQRQIVDALGRSTVGSAPIALGYFLASRGLAVGELPESERDRQQFWMEGKQPWSINIGGEWRSFERVSPAGNLLFIGAGIHRAMTEAGLPAGDRFVGAASSPLRMITQQPFLTGTKQVLDLATDPEYRGAGKFAGGLLSSAVPNIVRAFGRGVDPTIRETEGVAQRVQGAIPFMSRDLPARIDPLGGEVRRPSGIGGQMLDIFRSSPDKLEKDELLSALHESGITIGGRDKLPDETPEEYEQRMRDEGAQIKEMLTMAQQAGVLTPEYAPVIEQEISNLRSSMTEDAKLRRAMRALGVSVP